MDVGRRIKTRREQAGLNQMELAAKAGVSRQSIGAIESNTNLPRVDVAIAIAGALGFSVTELFGGWDEAVDVLTGLAPKNGSVKLGRVGEQLVSSPIRQGASGYEVIDGVIVDGHLEFMTSLVPGLVIAGCEPGLAIVEQSLRASGTGAMWVATSTASALTALDEGRAHAAVVHGVKRELDKLAETKNLQRIHFAKWRVGLGAGEGVGPDWQKRALLGEVPVVQREDGARIQQVFEDALEGTGPAPGPLASTHLEAAQRGLWAGIPALTFEPAASSVGLDFFPLANHVAELWFPARFAGEPSLVSALNLVSSGRFARNLDSIGGYDLSDIGTRVA